MELVKCENCYEKCLSVEKVDEFMMCPNCADDARIEIELENAHPSYSGDDDLFGSTDEVEQHDYCYEIDLLNEKD